MEVINDNITSTGQATIGGDVANLVSQETLTVRGSSQNTVVRLEKTSNDVALEFNIDNGFVDLYNWSVGVDFSTGGDLKFDTGSAVGGATKLMLTTGGNLALGTSSASAQFHIKGGDDLGETASFLLENDFGTDIIDVRNNGLIGIGITPNTNGSPTSGQHPSERMSFKEGDFLQLNSASFGGVAGGIKIVENNASFSNYGLKITYDTVSSSKANFVTQSANVVDGGLAVFRGTGRVAIFQTTTSHTPSQSLDVNGNARFRVIGSAASAGALHYASDGTLTTNTSDISLKENIKPLENSLDKVMELNGVSFDWKEGGEHSVGLIAQQVNEVIPELAFTNPNDDIMGVHYDKTVALLIEAIKELKGEIDELKNNQ